MTHQRIIPAGCPGQSGEQRSLTGGDIPRRGAEVERRGLLDPDGALPQRHPVQVLLQDHLLGEMGIEPEGPECLDHLAGKRARHGMEQSGELHCDGGGTGDHLPRPRISQQRPAQGSEIDTLMPVEPPVFRGDERDQQRRVHLRQRNPLLQGAFAGAGSTQRRAAAVQEPERGRGRLIEERLRQRQLDVFARR